MNGSWPVISSESPPGVPKTGFQRMSLIQVMPDDLASQVAAGKWLNARLRSSRN